MSAKIAAALHAVMSSVSYVQKTGKNDFHGYRYAGEADLLAALRPAMIEHGLMLMPSVESVSPVDANGNVAVLVSYTLLHKDGDVWPEKLMAAGMGNDRAKNGSVGDKGVYKAITGANKYLLFKLFQIETGDDPEVTSAHDKASDKPVPVSPAASPKAKSRDLYAEMIAELDSCNSLDDIGLLWSSAAFQAELKKMPPDWKASLTKHKDDLKAAINGPTTGHFQIPPDFSKMESVE